MVSSFSTPDLLCKAGVSVVTGPAQLLVKLAFPNPECGVQPLVAAVLGGELERCGQLPFVRPRWVGTAQAVALGVEVDLSPIVSPDDSPRIVLTQVQAGRRFDAGLD